MASDLNPSHIDGRSMSALTQHLLCSQEPETYKVVFNLEGTFSMKIYFNKINK